MSIACEYSCLSSLPAARDVSQERCLLLNEKNSTLTMQINVYIMQSSSHGVPNTNLLEFVFLLVYCGYIVSSPVNELQQHSL